MLKRIDRHSSGLSQNPLESTANWNRGGGFSFYSCRGDFNTMGETAESPSPPAQTEPHKNNAWIGSRPPKDPNYYADSQGKYAEYTRVNAFLTISQSLTDVKTKTISLLTTDVKCRKIIWGPQGNY